MKAIERVIQYIDYKGLNNSSFEKLIGVSNGYIGTQLKRNADLGEGILKKILDNCLDIDPGWILTGEGSMLKDDSNNIKGPDINVSKDEYIIELQKEKIEHLEAVIIALKKELASYPNYYQVAEPPKKLK